MDADKLNFLGDKAVRAGKFDLGIAYFQKAIEANPLLPQSYYNLGVCLMAIGDYSQALEFYKKALALSPSNTVILNNIGITYGKMDNQKNALVYYKKSLKSGSKKYFCFE